LTKILQHADVHGMTYDRAGEPLGEARNYYLWISQRWRKRQKGKPIPSETATDVSVVPYINRGRWIVECPEPDCYSAIVVTKAEPRFLCTRCALPSTGGKWVPIAFPEAAEIEEGERTLLQRPSVGRMDWDRHKGETLVDLQADNARFMEELLDDKGKGTGRFVMREGLEAFR